MLLYKTVVIWICNNCCLPFGCRAGRCYSSFANKKGPWLTSQSGNKYSSV